MRFWESYHYYKHYFGFVNAIKLSVVPRILGRIFRKDFYVPAVLKYQYKDSIDVIDKYKNDKSAILNGDVPDIIWVCWWQGKDQMPEVIGKCYNSLLKNANGRKVILIEKANYNQYASIPQYIIEKMKQGKISFSHFSDILRVTLLKTHGGMWVDAALFVTKPIPKFTDFFMPRMRPYGSFCQGKWCFGVMSGPKSHQIFSYMQDCLLDYWNRHDAVVDYLMFDGLLRLGYENVESIRQTIDALEVSSPDLHTSRYSFNEELDRAHFDKLIANNNFLSLTWRMKYSEKTEDGATTFYGALINTPPRIKQILIVWRYRLRLLKDWRGILFRKRLKILSSRETIQYILDNKCSVSRFGDGEFAIMAGAHNGFQKEDNKLAQRLTDALNNPSPGCLNCIWYTFRDSSYLTLVSKDTYYGFVLTYFNRNVRPFLNLNTLYGDSLFSRFYMSHKDKSEATISQYVQLLKSLWHNRDVLIVEGLYSQTGKGNDLYDNAKSLRRILCPNKNAFDKYDEILAAVKHHAKKDDLILLCLGMSATVMAHDLSRIGLQAIDLGHVDTEYEWFRMGAKEKRAIPGKVTNEVADGYKHIKEPTFDPCEVLCTIR